MKIHQRHMLKSKDVKDLKAKLIGYFGEDNIKALFGKKKSVEWIKLEDRQELLAIGGTLCFWYFEEKYIPLLSLLINPKINFEMKYVKVDTGAIRFVTNGADVMRPGIIEIDPSIKKGDVLKILDPVHNRALAVGIADYDGPEMQEKTGGKVIRNIHTIKDTIWKFSKEF